MSTSLKFIIPLLDNNLTLDDISDKAGFVGVYTQDINRPYLDHHIFLVYVVGIATQESKNRFEKFKSLKTISNTKCVNIKGYTYIVYTFPIINKAIDHIINGALMLSKDDKLRIICFWQLKDRDINDFMISSFYLIGEFKDAVLPEEDYSEPYAIAYDKESGALTYVSTPL